LTVEPWVVGNSPGHWLHR